MRRPISFALVTLALAAAGCGGGGKTASLGPEDVAVVGSKEITKDQFRTLMGRAEKVYEARKQTFPKPGSTAYETLKGNAIAFLVLRAEYAEKADDLGIKVSNQEIDKRVAQLKQAYGGSDERYRQTLKQQGLTEEQAREEVRVQLISEKITAKVTEKSKVSDDEIKKYYDSHKSSYQDPESREVRHILVTKRALADRLYNQLQAGADFAKLAKKYSQDPGSKEMGGKLTVFRDRTVPPFERAAFGLKTMEISKPIKSQYGYHIIQPLAAKKPARPTPLEKVKATIRQQLEQQDKGDVMARWLADTKKEFCSGSRLKYQVGYKPTPDPCATASTTTR